jgi:polyferredoxin
MPPNHPTSDVQHRRRIDRTARRAVQAGFLLLFLYPLFLAIYQRVTAQVAPNLASWLLPWDPLLLVGRLAHRDWASLAGGALLWIGLPLLLVALTLALGRVFCGWICPLGAVLDLVRPLAIWQRRRGPARTARLFPANANSRARYYLLAAVALGGLFSLQALALLDPLVIFHRTSTALAGNFLALRQPPLRIFLSVISVIFLAILLLELWQPRFWCRNLCPLGALISIFSRFSLLNRRVSSACTLCGDCRRTCVMNAIPRKEPHDTRYADCTFCLECESACPKAGISFGFGALAWQQWQRGPQKLQGRYRPRSGRLGVTLTRREALSGMAAGAAGLALAPLIHGRRQNGALRPPGALPEEAFVRTCILCQECVRVCPTGGLKPVTFEAGLAALGTPQLVPLAGACTRNPSCPGLCADVCPVGAILPIAPEQVKIGRAVVDHPLCLAWDQQVKCLVCVEACLVEAAQMYNGRIVVDPQRCTGCGRCENACPVAGSAIHVRPFSTLG